MDVTAYTRLVVEEMQNFVAVNHRTPTEITVNYQDWEEIAPKNTPLVGSRLLGMWVIVSTSLRRGAVVLNAPEGYNARWSWAPNERDIEIDAMVRAISVVYGRGPRRIAELLVDEGWRRE